MDTFYIIPNETKDVNLEITNRIIDYVEKHGGKCTWDELGLPCSESGMALPCGATGRWMSE